MDQAQTEIPVTGNLKNHETGKKTLKQDSLGTEASAKEKADNKEELQLSDILKPSTLIAGIIALVLAVLYGWYAFVLKPALNDNQSMIHFITPVTTQAVSPKDGSKNQLSTAPVTKAERASSDSISGEDSMPSQKVESVPPIVQPVESSQSTAVQMAAPQTPATQTIFTQAGDSKVVSSQTLAPQTENLEIDKEVTDTSQFKTKTGQWKHKKRYYHHSRNVTRDNRNFNINTANCTQAQIALHHC